MSILSSAVSSSFGSGSFCSGFSSSSFCRSSVSRSGSYFAFQSANACIQSFQVRSACATGSQSCNGNNC
ncbi:hypothetical protein A1507_15025 [Methylomonas koyamae]|uniref:Uncharacterized protein n=1 Tax=Methylomonas koyamae TaxID=702114 RepID=A0A177NAX1_9GAMM|nr:hypothetical protein A1507_15025 [Methylomonas koyamae]